jgi:hypothetical protein
MGLSWFKSRKIFSMTPREVQQAVAEGGDAASYIAGNTTEGFRAIFGFAADSTKGAITTHSGSRIGESAFKGAKDYARGDMMCTGLCAISGTCETAAGIIVWIPMPAGKVCAVSALKGISYGCMKVRNLCAAEPGNPLC